MQFSFLILYTINIVSFCQKCINKNHSFLQYDISTMVGIFFSKLVLGICSFLSVMINHLLLIRIPMRDFFL